VEYTPDECVLTALAGTPLSEIRDLIAAHGQYLPFDPPLVEHGATLGGTVAMGLSGSGRLRYGGVRDFVIGARVVDGEGRAIRSGGKVVKNAAGFLLHHAIVGSRGRLVAIAELTLKVFPSPPARATLRISAGHAEEARAHVAALRAFDLEALDMDSDRSVCLRVAGRRESLGERVSRLEQITGGRAMDEPTAVAMWRDAGEFAWAPADASLIKSPGDEPLPGALSARITCGGQITWSAVADVAACHRMLLESGRRALVVRGPGVARIIGRNPANPFADRVRHALDPHHRFRAASPAD
jgi:glycolate oxidase FAD binding subunit